jgi:TM2 domain-containing membrane protein YozV
MNKHKLILFILSISFCSGVINAQYLNELRLRQDVTFTDTIKSTQILAEKSPFLAGSLSFIVPGFGLGQLYNQQHGKFIRHAGISVGCIVFTYMAIKYNLIEIGFEGEGKNEGMLFALFFLYLGNWVWSIMDAADSADEINKQIMLQKYRSDILNRIKLGFNVDKNKQLNLKFAFEL